MSYNCINNVPEYPKQLTESGGYKRIYDKIDIIDESTLSCLNSIQSNVTTLHISIMDIYMKDEFYERHKTEIYNKKRDFKKSILKMYNKNKLIGKLGHNTESIWYSLIQLPVQNDMYEFIDKLIGNSITSRTNYDHYFVCSSSDSEIASSTGSRFTSATLNSRASILLSIVPTLNLICFESNPKSTGLQIGSHPPTEIFCSSFGICPNAPLITFVTNA